MEKTAGLKRIEILGQLGAEVAVSISSTADFTGAKPLAISKATAVPTLEIKKATYGNGGQMADVTGKVRQSVVSGSLSLTAENALCDSDPAPDKVKQLRIEFSLDGKDEVALVTEGKSISLGAAKLWSIDLPAGTSARFIRLARTQDGPPLRVNEIRVIGKFE